MALSIKGIVFDCDGTLVDSEYAHFLSWKEILKQKGYELFQEESINFSGVSDHTVSLLLEKQTGLNAKELLKKKIEHFDQTKSLGLPPIREAVDFMKRLVQDYPWIKLGLASAARREEILFHLEHLGITPYFTVILSGEDDLDDYFDPEGVNKPKPYIYLKMAKLLGLKPNECLAFEDSFTGVTAAVDAGFYTVAIPTLYTKGHDLSRADLIIPSLKLTLPELLEKI